jgi:hypothetical protein
MVGRKLLYTGGFLLFVLSSALCGLAPSLPVLIAFRVAQGIGAALLSSNSVASRARVRAARVRPPLKPAPPGKRRLVWDAVVPGLAVRVTDQGKRTFVLITRYPGSRHPAPRALGSVGALTLEAARAKAREWLKLIASAVDPGIQELERREQTFKAIAENYFGPLVDGRR